MARILISLDIQTLTMLVTVWTASQHLVLVISSDDPWSVGPRRNRTAYHYLLLKLSTLLLVLALVLVISSDDPWSVGPRRNRTAYHYLLLKLSTLLLVLAVLNCYG